ncbi:hypothetical protein NMY3_02834 [Candidatus Nitrosocosmicus oleophilus]|jgi:hypothetical protein|uniref:Uncharacterized protein n=2 Tax=Candidatus Nitrosocosmicus oleophilus TaxID=1353260 RepID=A0A654M302_9ARCH|nr:hypothetical protein NMY3_02834 [Candidatus Nitrosocosmicus oleophilus]
MNRNLLIVYALCGILVATGIVYFLVAYGEYTDWVELLNFGIHDETTEKQVEITLFITSGLIYLGLVLWLIKTRFMKKSPYIAAIVVSVALIITYAASRTVGVPIVGVELYVGKLDVISKIMQVLVIALSIVALYKIKRPVYSFTK